jgi:hypothetical protein
VIASVLYAPLQNLIRDVVGLNTLAEAVWDGVAFAVTVRVVRILWVLLTDDDNDSLRRHLGSVIEKLKWVPATAGARS